MSDEDYVLGPCGCEDYHMADCPTRTARHKGPPEVDPDDPHLWGEFDD